MLPQTSRRRAGFTLIELLVVIAIIAILMSLTTAAVQRVRVLGPQTENFSRLSQIAECVGRAKHDLKLEYIPSHPVSTGGFWLKRSYGQNDPELEFLLRAFPSMDLADNGYTGSNVQLNGNQVLCLFLTGGAATNFTGFSNNPRKPFLAGAAGELRKGPILENNPKLFAPGPGGHPQLVDVYGTPYAYFASIGGKPNNYGTQSFNGTSFYTSGGKAVNEKGFQIISAGRDKAFGTGGALPAGGPGEDDHAHFSKSLLGGGLN